MRRGYDPRYGSREQLKDSHESGMKLRREVDALKAQNTVLVDQAKALIDEITELKALIAYITQGE
tara:strand:- start:255 stop:449 length:195 start_codon:yes stop_codon:yes gene_type:complete